jgi:hypothetical protein
MRQDSRVRQYPRVAACVLGACAILPGLPAIAGNGGLVCGGFETCQPVAGLPSTFGVWAADPMDAAMAQQGITPLEGAWMLHFNCTSPTPPCDGAGGSGSDIHQLVDLAPFADLVAGGNAVATLTAWFNRVDGDAQTDTEFIAGLLAFDGDVSDFPSLPPSLDAMNDQLFSDSDTVTWESVTVELTIPPEATYLDVSLSAIEDVFNDPSAPAFDGHYADAVTLGIAPACPWDCGEPADGQVGVVDFLAVLAQWGTQDGCDFDGGGVGVTDFLALLANWGACP